MTNIRTLDQISADIEQQEKIMYVHQKNGNFADAEKSRLKVEQLNKDLEARAIYEMEIRHKKQWNELTKANNNELAAFNNLMDHKMHEIKEQSEKSQHDLIDKHKKQLEATRKQLQIQFSPKVKQSSQLLNLRQMERFTSKQKKFQQAHQIQQIILNKEKAQTRNWLQRRQEHIQTALNTLKSKQSTELANLRQRFNLLLDELLTQRKIQEKRLEQKHENFHKDLKSQHDKQLLNYKGQFRSKGGRDSPLRLKSSFIT